MVHHLRYGLPLEVIILLIGYKRVNFTNSCMKKISLVHFLNVVYHVLAVIYFSFARIALVAAI